MVCTPYDVNKAQLQIFFWGGGGVGGPENQRFHYYNNMPLPYIINEE